MHLRHFTAHHIAIVATLLLLSGCRTQSSLNAAFFRAVRNGDRASVVSLAAQGADVNALEDDRSTPLSIAAHNGNLEICKTLIDRKANVNAQVPPRNEFPAMSIVLADAVEGGHVEVVRLLLEKGVVVDARAGSGVTPLMVAVMGNHIDIVKLLIARGADVNAKDERGFTVGHFAQGKHETDRGAILVLLKHAGARF
jgi:ankyrin repeat protein